MIFENESFISHAGLALDFKINCDAFDVEDWLTLASLVSTKFIFGEVYGIPSGGTLFANKLQKYATGDKKDAFLIVDDVLTTGTSFQETLHKLNISEDREVIGVVVFSRAKFKLDGIYPIFQMW